MTGDYDPSPLAVPIDEARSRLEALLREGERLRAQAVDIGNETGTKFAVLVQFWFLQRQEWVGRVANALEHAFATRAESDRFSSAAPSKPGSFPSAGEFPQGREALGRQLAVLRAIYTGIAARTTVFLVHGRDRKITDGLSLLLKVFGLDVLGWEQAAEATGRGAPTTLEIVQAGVRKADAVVVLFTPDDIAHLRDDLVREPGERDPMGQPRMNVVFEAGMAMPTVRDRDRVVIIRVGRVREFTDISGINIIRLDDSADSRLALAARLETAGLTVQLDGADGADWRSAGSFGS